MFDHRETYDYIKAFIVTHLGKIGLSVLNAGFRIVRGNIDSHKPLKLISSVSQKTEKRALSATHIQNGTGAFRKLRSDPCKEIKIRMREPVLMDSFVIFRTIGFEIGD